MPRTDMTRAFLVACTLAAVPMGQSAFANGPSYIFDYASGTPYRWDVSTPVRVCTDMGNFASGTVWLYGEANCGAGQRSCQQYIEFDNLGLGDINGVPGEMTGDVNEAGDPIHAVIGSDNGGGVHVLFDEDGSILANVTRAPPGVLGIASPE